MSPETLPRFQAKLADTPTKKLLALDGGGIRGLITVEVLAGIEALLRKELGNETLVLADYFDYIAGTSTGAIIATCLSLGMSIDTVRDFYVANGQAMFDKAALLDRFRFKYNDTLLADKLRKVLREEAIRGGDRDDPTFGSPALRTLLLIVMRNATTDSPWPISNNPTAKYNVRTAQRPASNLDIPLWQLVRASTAAPTYFPPEDVPIGDKNFLFVDGGITMYNNPAFLVFLMSTMGVYKLGWKTGEDRMLVVSVGTGTAPDANANLDPTAMNLVYNASKIPSALMFAALNEQDVLCRVFGRCRVGTTLDREIGSLIDTPDEPGQGLLPKLFTYARYNAELTTDGLKTLGLAGIVPEDVQMLDSVAHIGELQRVGRAVGATVDRAHFDGFLG